MYKASDPIGSLPELLEEFAKKIAALESRVADLEANSFSGVRCNTPGSSPSDVNQMEESKTT